MAKQKGGVCGQVASAPTPERLARAAEREQVCVVDAAAPGPRPAWTRLALRGPLARLAGEGLIDAASLEAARRYAADYERAHMAPLSSVRLEDAPRSAGGGLHWLDVRIAAAQRLAAADRVLGERGREILRAALGLGRDAGLFAPYLEGLFPRGAAFEAAGGQARGRGAVARRSFRRGAAAGVLVALLLRLTEFYDARPAS